MSLDRVIGLLAPHRCVVCDREGSLACEPCRPRILSTKRSTCFLCNKLTKDWRTCATCSRLTKLRGAIVASHYENYVKQLMGLLKYQRAQSAASLLGEFLTPFIPVNQFDLVITTPAATARLRQRGYNPAYLITKQIAIRLKLPYLNNLRRLGQSRQVGTDRRQRIKQIKGQIYLVQPQLIAGKRILLIDDVITTGATMSECAWVLKQAGAKYIWGAAIAKH